MFGRKERKTKGKKIKVIEKKMLFFYVIWYIGKKESEKLVKLKFNNFKYFILFQN